MSSEIQKEEMKRLTRRLFASVLNGRVRDIKALLALGANPNWPATDWPAVAPLSSPISLPLVFPLAALPFSRKSENRVSIVETLVDAGASVDLALAWLSVNPLYEWRVSHGLVLCQVLSASRHPKGLDRVVRRWLWKVAKEVNSLPEPTIYHERNSCLRLHRDFKTTMRLFGLEHMPSPWVMAEWL